MASSTYKLYVALVGRGVCVVFLFSAASNVMAWKIDKLWKRIQLGVDHLNASSLLTAAAATERTSWQQQNIKVADEYVNSILIV